MKAQGLLRMKKWGLPVPPFELWESPPPFSQEKLLNSEDDKELLFQASALRKLCLNLPWTDAETKKLSSMIDRISVSGKYALALRSSALGEDSVDHSFAGQMDTFLSQRGLESIQKALRACQASAYSDRAVLYRHKRGLPQYPIPMTVILQRMVQSESSGVLFTQNWIQGKSHHFLISSLWGLGEGLVGGTLEGDQFFVTPKGQVQESVIANKTQRMVSGNEGGTVLQDCPPELVGAPSLSPQNLKVLAQWARRLRKRTKQELDLEFAVEEGQVYLLQMRPITSLGKKADFPRVWDNANITESYPGITQPLTFSFITQAYEGVYRQFCTAAGVPDWKIEANSPVFAHMLGLLKGRVYYNLLSWYQVVSFLPGFQFNKTFLEEMMGLSTVSDLIPPAPAPSFFRKWFLQLPSLALMGGKLLFKLLFLNRVVKKFFHNFYFWYNQWKVQN